MRAFQLKHQLSENNWNFSKSELEIPQVMLDAKQ